MNNKGDFTFVRLIFISIAFLIVFGYLASVVSDSGEMFSNMWSATDPFLSFIMRNMNILIFTGFVLFVFGSLAVGMVLSNNE